MSAVNHRLRKLIEKLKIQQVEIADEIGVTSQAVSQYIGQKTAISQKVQLAICEAYPALNANWFLFGRGQMFNEVKSTEIELIESDYLKKLLKEKEMIINLLKQRIDDLEAQCRKETK